LKRRTAERDAAELAAVQGKARGSAPAWRPPLTAAARDGGS
jgi:hypothetical protein